jgi:ATP-dependent RNA helicase SUPV3L1/SUV3
MEGFRFRMDKAGSPDEAKTLRQASVAALVPHWHLMADRFYNAPDPELDFTEQGGLMWGEHAVGKLVAGSDLLKPQAQAFVDEEAGADVAAKVQRRLQHFIDRKIAAGFEPLLKLKGDEALTGLAKGFAYRLSEGFGVVPRGEVADDVKALDQDARGALRKHGIRFGQFTVFMPLLLKPAPTRLRLVLWSLAKGLQDFPETPPPGLVTVPAAKGVPPGYYAMAGYRAAGERAIRIDMLERLADMLRDKDSKGGFEANPDMLSITGMTLDQFADLMTGLGYKAEKGEREKVRHVAAPSAEAAPEVTEAETDFPAEAPAESPSETAAEAAPEGPEMEVFYTFTWAGRAQRQARPQGARGGRDKAQGDRPQGERPQGERPRGKGRGKDKGRGGKGREERDEKPLKFQSKPKHEKKIDPDNPFAAALAGFKPE